MRANKSETLRLAMAQIAPVWLKREETIAKMIGYIEQAADQNCDLVIFGEALLPGYPFWIELTNGAQFNSKIQKEMFAWYMQEAVQIEAGHLDDLCKKAKDRKIAIVTGTVERPADRGSHSLYCSMVHIDQKGEILNVHRKLQPTYEERLCWSPGDGHGLRVQSLGAFTVGGLNCWENWMPLSRSALYAQGEDLHIAIWPGGFHNTFDTTPFLAKEGRSFVAGVSGLMRKSDIPDGIPHADLIRENSKDILSNGGSCLADPTGKWIIDPITNEEKLLVAEINHQLVREERHNFDPAGHYSRPDVTRLEVNRERHRLVDFSDQ